MYDIDPDDVSSYHTENAKRHHYLSNIPDRGVGAYSPEIKTHFNNRVALIISVNKPPDNRHVQKYIIKTIIPKKFRIEFMERMTISCLSLEHGFIITPIVGAKRYE